jgi:hypothetical protein
MTRNNPLQVISQKEVIICGAIFSQRNRGRDSQDSWRQGKRTENDNLLKEIRVNTPALS